MPNSNALLPSTSFGGLLCNSLHYQAQRSKGLVLKARCNVEVVMINGCYILFFISFLASLGISDSLQLLVFRQDDLSNLGCHDWFSRLVLLIVVGLFFY
jgi:hypothetical protein